MELHDSLFFQLKGFDIYRKREGEKATIRIAAPVVYNAYGAAGKKYLIYDTLRQKGQYTYSIFGNAADDVLLLSREKIIYPKIANTASRVITKSYKRRIEYYCKKDGQVSIQVHDGVSGKKLFSTSKRSTKGQNDFTIDLFPLAAEGIFLYKIIIKGKDFEEEHIIKFASDTSE